MKNSMKSVVILGGGTAGWIAANLLATHWGDEDIEFTLVESPNIGIIGVGEGSTPPLKSFFEVIGASESDWMSRCDATYKVGITFRDWSARPGFDEYFHPFLCQPDEFSVPAFFHNSFLRRQGVDLDGHPSQFFLAWQLATKRLAPVAPPNFPFEMNYGYHFNSGLLGQFLQEWAEKKGVRYRQATVTDVVLAENGFIDHLKTAEDDIIKADFYVDSTGFRSELLQRTLGVPFDSCDDVLFNDSAVVFPTDPDDNPEPQTVSTALKYGWAWKIPLTSRFGNGYVYSSKYVDDDDCRKGIPRAPRSHRQRYRIPAAEVSRGPCARALVSQLPGRRFVAGIHRTARSNGARHGAGNGRQVHRGSQQGRVHRPLPRRVQYANQPALRRRARLHRLPLPDRDAHRHGLLAETTATTSGFRVRCASC